MTKTEPPIECNDCGPKGVDWVPCKKCWDAIAATPWSEVARKWAAMTGHQPSPESVPDECLGNKLYEAIEPFMDRDGFIDDRAALANAVIGVVKKHRTPDLEGFVEIRDGLDVLSKLGNGARDGNSTGNAIAQRLRAKLDTIMGDASTRKDEASSAEQTVTSPANHSEDMLDMVKASESSVAAIERLDHAIRKYHPQLDGKRSYAGEIYGELSSEISLKDESLIATKLVNAIHTYVSSSDLPKLELARRATCKVMEIVRPYMRPPEPVMVSLEKCARALARQAGDESEWSFWLDEATVVLDAAGVKYVD